MWVTALYLLVSVLCCGADELIVVKLPQEQSASNRIVGGNAAAIESYPYAVQIYKNNFFLCGGSLITIRHVLSAAHCFYDYDSNNGGILPASLFSIRVGTSTLYTGGSTRRVSTIINHERFNVTTNENDIAVLLLASNVTFSAQVQQASIVAAGSSINDNSSVVHIGWGDLYENANQGSPILNEVAVFKVNQAECARRFQLISTPRMQYVVTSNMMCAGILDVGGKDACQGDSGGPLLYQDVVVGVTSWGLGCARATVPGVSTSVTNYTTWIQDVVSRYSGSPPTISLSYILLFASIVMAFSYKN